MMLSWMVVGSSLLGMTAGCFGSGDGSAGPGDSLQSGSSMTMRKTCLKTTCDQKLEDHQDACSDCLSACSYASYGCDPSDACEFSCKPTECSEYALNNCEVEGFEAVLPAEQDFELYFACEDAVSAVQACGYSPSLKCATYAHVERPEMAAQYSCMAQLPCEAYLTPAAASACSPPPTTFGDELCNAVSACNLCSPEDLVGLNAYGGWLKSEVLEAAKSCASHPSCSDQAECLYAWREAIE